MRLLGNLGVHWLSGALLGLKSGRLAKGVGGCEFPTPLPSRKRLLMPLGEWWLSCRRPPDANKTLAGV